MHKDRPVSPKNHQTGSGGKSPYQVEFSPSKELLQQYSEDPTRVNILPLIEKKMQYSHKPRRSVLASYERLAEYRDLADSVPSSPESPGGRSAPRKSKMPLNLILGQEANDYPNPLTTSVRTESRAHDSEAPAASPTNKLLPSYHPSGQLASDNESSPKQEYFPSVENSFKLVETKKYNSPVQESRRKSRPSKFAAAVSRAQTPAETSSVKENSERKIKGLQVGNTSQSQIMNGRANESQNQSQDYSQNRSMRRDVFVLKSPHRSYLDIMAAASQSKRSEQRTASKTGLSAGSPKGSVTITLKKPTSTTNSRNSSLKRLGRGLDVSWAKIYGLARPSAESAEPSIVKEATKNMLGKKYTKLEDSQPLKPKHNGYLLPSLSTYSIQQRSRPDIIVLPSKTHLQKNRSPEQALRPSLNPNRASPQISESTSFPDERRLTDPRLEECFKLSLDFREVLILLVKFSQTHKQRIDQLVQQIFDRTTGERGLRMVVLSVLGPDDAKLRLQPEQKVELARVMEFLNINHGRWRPDVSSPGYDMNHLDEAAT